VFAELVNSVEYKQQLSNPHYPEPANAYLCLAMLKEKAVDYSSAGWAALRAAWVCDDEAFGCESNEYPDGQDRQQSSIVAAKKCRTRAAHIFECARQSGQDYGEEPGIEEVILADVLRRSDQFDEAKQICKEALGKELGRISKDVIKLQMRLAKDADNRTYTLRSIDSQKLHRLARIPRWIDRLRHTPKS